MEAKQTHLVLISICDEFAAGNRSLADFVAQYGYATQLYFLGRYSGMAQTVSAQDIDRLVEAVSEASPQVIGVSVRTFYHEVAQDLTARLRDVLPDALIVWGGAHPTILPDECVRHADAVCLGEGEEALLDLLNVVEDDAWPAAISGMWVRQGEHIIQGEFREPIQDLSSLPVFSPGGGDKFLIENGRRSLYDDVPLAAMKRYGVRQYNIITSRGCPFSCSYCINSFLHKKHPRLARIRRRSVDHVIGELKNIKDRIDVVNFEDDDFLADQEWIRDFLARYTSEIALPFMCLASPVHVQDEAYLRALREAGLVSINVGIQSGSARTQKIFHRPFKREHLPRVADLCFKLRILAQYDLILNNPFETDEDILETLNLLLDMRRPFRLNLFSLTFFPNYEITKIALAQGVISAPEMGYTKFEDQTGDYASNSHLNNLIYLTQISFFPKFLIKWMAKQQWLKARPGITKFLVKLTQNTLGGRVLYLFLLLAWNFKVVVSVVLRRTRNN
ncbi:MAG: B12-binding domain-containing radical SAM protein [Anaerolineae bacterium]|nr:B12-binding domain-containing radical SAM protein [Anaerolineae bacterium]